MICFNPGPLVIRCLENDATLTHSSFRKRFQVRTICQRFFTQMFFTNGKRSGSWDNTLENFFFQISSYSRAYVRINYEETKGQVPLGPLLGKQNIQAKGVQY